MGTKSRWSIGYNKLLQEQNIVMKMAKTIKEYISNYPKEVSSRLSTIHKIVKKLAPKAEEKISYGMPAYKMDGVLLYFAAHKNHIGLYPYPSAMKKFELYSTQYKTAKGSIQFQNDENFPVGLITKIIKYRVNEKLKSKK